MTKNDRICPQCRRGHMRLIGKVHDEITNIRLYECDNMHCKFKSAMTRAKN